MVNIKGGTLACMDAGLPVIRGCRSAIFWDHRYLRHGHDPCKNAVEPTQSTHKLLHCFLMHKLD